MLQFIDLISFLWRKYAAKILKKILYSVTILSLVILFFGKPILRGLGSFLSANDTLIEADALFVLGGNNYDRSLLAYELFNQEYAPIIYTLGQNVSNDIAILGHDDIPDAILSQEFLLDLGLSVQEVVALPKGTSTFEEADIILKESLQKKYKTIIIISDMFHLRRVSNVMKNKFEAQGIQVILAGASNSNFDEKKWWQYESGLIMLNNEYLKLIYYWIKGY